MLVASRWSYAPLLRQLATVATALSIAACCCGSSRSTGSAPIGGDQTPPTTKRGCTSDNDCKTGMGCSNGACVVKDCSQNPSICPSGTYCIQGSCNPVPKTPKPTKQCSCPLGKKYFGPCGRTGCETHYTCNENDGNCYCNC